MSQGTGVRIEPHVPGYGGADTPPMPQGTGAYPHRYVRTYIAYFRPLLQKNTTCSSKCQAAEHHVACQVHHVACQVHHVACQVHHVACQVHHVACQVHHVACQVYHVACKVYHVACQVHHVAWQVYHVSCQVYYVMVKCAHINNINITSCSLYNTMV